MDLNVKVAVRCRPMNSKETNRGSTSVVTMTKTTVHIKNSEGHPKDFTFDHCYFTDSTQEKVYEDLGKSFQNLRFILSLYLSFISYPHILCTLDECLHLYYDLHH